ncbi:tetratricopeptide repeat protein [Micromonospora craniellae]|uniref:Tetratricopeptide repeat protein n=1 Tax=Micromonospora craniellae TaxID=2294034 RepID=A0A372FRS7_9ACTN|nr:tetratricopeptide repeat protein [Micromonospora craniellae]
MVAIHAVDGMPGVGKTALARHVAHLVADRFPDGQLFVDLHAHSPDRAPSEPGDVLAGLLAATGLTAEHIPEGTSARADRWRDRMAGKRLLLVLDNAATGEQVAPLLPGSAGCLVLITSRRRLARLRRDYGATILPLEVLPESEAVALFTRVHPHRLDAAGQAAVVRLVRLCGYLPLAITVLASGIGTDGQTSGITDVLADLEVTQDRLASIDEYRDSLELGVAAVFDLSYQRLTAEQQRVLRLLSLTPGTDIDLYAAAALTDLPVTAVQRHLRDLYTHHLAEQPAHHRYRLHDLINLYARAHTITDEADAAAGRLLDFYQHTAAIAATRIRRRGTTPHHTTTPACTSPVPDLPDQAQATAWLRAERANLAACVAYTRRHSQHARTVDLAASFAAFLRQDGPWTDGIALQTDILTIVKGFGDRNGEAWTLSELGNLRVATGDYPQATVLLERALTIHLDIGDRHGEAYTVTELGCLRRLTGDYLQAAALLERALAVFRGFRDRNGESWVLCELANLRRLTGDYPQATALQEQSLAIRLDIADRHGEAWTLAELGRIWRLAGDYLQAAALLERALAVFRGFRDRNGESWVLCELANLRRLTGDYPQATALLEKALTTARDLGDRQTESEVLNYQGDLLRSSGNSEPARACHVQALRLAREAGSPLDEARALAGIGRCAVATSVINGIADMRRALEIFRRLGAAEAAELAAEIDAIS